MGACLNEENQIMIVTEFASRGDLKHCLNDIESIAHRLTMLHDVVTGLHWLQAYNIVHRDLKLDNLLVTEDWTVKITCVFLRNWFLQLKINFCLAILDFR